MKKDLHELLPMAHGFVLCCWHPLCHDRSRGTSKNLESIVHKVQMHKGTCINDFTLREICSAGSVSSVGGVSVLLFIWVVTCVCA